MLFDRPELSPAMKSYLGHITADPVVRRVVRPEDPGMYGVQTWSAGPIYPAIIRVVETYAPFDPSFDGPLSDRLLSRKYVLTIPGAVELNGELVEFTFDTRGAAETFALSMQRRDSYADLGLVV